jgi:5-methylcytosine-specific restriction endonuclease McrA
MRVLLRRGALCECCGARPPDVRINVDHIKPRRTHPELALDEANLQVLCEDCNHGKGSWDTTDWRAPGTTQGELTDSPVPGTATATSIFSSSVAPRLVRRR